MGHQLALKVADLFKRCRIDQILSAACRALQPDQIVQAGHDDLEGIRQLVLDATGSKIIVARRNQLGFRECRDRQRRSST